MDTYEANQTGLTEPAADAACLALVVDNKGRGERIQERLDALGISDREFDEATGIARSTLRRAVAEEPRVRPSTYDAIETALARLESRNRGISPEPRDPGDDLIEFRLSGNFGVDVVVKGPIRDRGELEAAVTRLIREMRGESNPDTSGDF